MYTMEYLSQVDNVVEVLSFLLTKIHFNQDINDLNLLKHLSSLNSVIRDFKSRAHQTKEEGELEGFTNIDLESEIKVNQSDNRARDEEISQIINDPGDTPGTEAENPLKENLQESENEIDDCIKVKQESGERTNFSRAAFSKIPGRKIHNLWSQPYPTGKFQTLRA